MSGLEVVATGMMGLVAKATAVLCLALALAWLARRGSVRTLHLLWTTTFVVLLALPVASLVGPSWPVPILPVRDTNADEPSLEMTAEETSASGVERKMPGSPVSSESPSRVAQSRTSSASPAFESELLPPVASDYSAPLSPATIAFLTWALGCGAALTSLAVGGFRFRKLVREAVPVRDPDWLSQADSIRRRVRIQTDVRVLLSAEASTPMTGGLWRPLIVLPSSAAGWTPDRREVVLTHELVHVRRRDALRHLLGRVAAACYWFHPLGWLASRLSESAGERSCDEEVLALGARPSEYAQHLFSLASETAGGSTVLACRMVQRSQLEDRITSILRQNRPRYSPARTSVALAVIGVAGTLVACGTPVAREPAARPSPPAETPASNDTRTDEPSINAPAPEPTPPANPMREPPTPEITETERLAVAPTASERMPSAPPVTGAPAAGLRGVGPASAPLATPEAANPQPLRCNPGKWIIVRRSGEWTLQRHVDGIRVCMRNRGNVEIGSHQVATGSADDGRWLVLESQAERLHRLVVTSGSGGLEYDWSIDGRSEVFGARAREWRDLMLTVMNGYLEVQDVLAEEGSLHRQIGAHHRHVSGLQRQIGAHHRHVGGLQRQVASMRASMRKVEEPTEEYDIEGRIRGIEIQIEEYDLEDKIREIEIQIEDYDLERKIREIEIQIEDHDLERKIREVETQIQDYDLEGKIAETESRIEEFDADHRIEEIERLLEDDIAALRRIIG